MNVILNKIPKFNEHTELEVAVAATSSDEVLIPFEEADQKIIILVSNSGASSANVTFKKGNMLQGTEDLTIAVPASKTIAVSLESGKFKNTDGNVKATVSANLGFQLIALP